MPQSPQFGPQVLYPGGAWKRPIPKIPKRRLGLKNIERVVLGVWLVLVVGVGIYLSLPNRPSEARAHKAVDVFLGGVSEIKPKEYDSAKELRVALSESTGGQPLKPFAARLSGPWRFGLADADTVALALGKPASRGEGYLLYETDAKLRITVLFNAGRLDTIVLAPQRCPTGKSPCDHPNVWSLNQDQIVEESLQPDAFHIEGEGSSLLASTARGLFYAVKDSPAPAKTREITGVYIQRLTKDVLNPGYVRGIIARGASKATADPARPLDADGYRLLLMQFEAALRLKEKILGPDHLSVHFLRFELGRMQLESGHAAEGRQVMLAALQPVIKSLGKEHRDVAAMLTWTEGKN